MQMRSMESAPRDGTEILVYFDHDADPYQADEDGKLTSYAAWAEGGDFLDGKGFAIAKWCEAHWESQDEYGSGYWLPAYWFSRGDDRGYESVVHPVRWCPLPDPAS
jgi:hypothetical protein